MKPRICSFDSVGGASHCAAGPPAAAIAENGVSPVRFHGKRCRCSAMKPTNAAIATRPCLISAWRRKPITGSGEYSEPDRLAGASGL